VTRARAIKSTTRRARDSTRRRCVVIGCNFQPTSEHSTSLGRVRYQRCACGRIQMLLNSDVLIEGSSETSPPQETHS